MILQKSVWYPIYLIYWERKHNAIGWHYATVSAKICSQIYRNNCDISSKKTCHRGTQYASFLVKSFGGSVIHVLWNNIVLATIVISSFANKVKLMDTIKEHGAVHVINLGYQRDCNYSFQNLMILKLFSPVPAIQILFSFKRTQTLRK